MVRLKNIPIDVDWEEIVEEYYKQFNVSLCKFGLVLKHLGTTCHHFKQEVRRALAGQFLVVFLVIPILAIFGPQEFNKKQSEKRKSASFERGNSVRHLVQMMSITERDNETNEEEEEEEEDSVSPNLLLRDKKLTEFVTDLLTTARNLKILESLPSTEGRRRSGRWAMTKQTTGRYKPNYSGASHLLSTETIGSCG